MRRLAAALHADRRGSSAAEFALVLPILLLFLIGTVDLGRLTWTWNRAEKATQKGARFAVVTDVVPAGLASYDFVGTNGLYQGDPIPLTSFGGATCTGNGASVSCACDTGATCPPLGTASATAFNNIVARMQRFLPSITANNVIVKYGYSGLGYAGNPNGIQVSPLVTVQLRDLTFSPVLFYVFGTSITLPSFSSTLSLEDGTGTVSN